MTTILKILFFFAFILALGFGFSWIADRPREIVALERQAEGLIAEILGLESKDFSGVAND